MIHSTVSPSDADAAQRQVDQLFGILQQLLHDTMQWLAARNQQSQKQEEVLRIWMGNGKDDRILRQVYGPMANGKTRNDLTPERLRTLLNALQQPVAEGIDPAQYAKQKPAIEIKIDDVTLFRQERDGIVTVNQIQQQFQNAPIQSQPLLPRVESPEVLDQALPTLDQVQQMTQVARHLMNPLNESNSPLLTKAGFGDFTLEYDPENDTLAISRGQNEIARDQAGQVENLGATVADWEAFRSVSERMLRMPVIQSSERNQHVESDLQDRLSSEALSKSQNRMSSAVAQVADRQIAHLPKQQLRQFIQRMVQGTATWLNQSLSDWQLKTIAHTAQRAFQRGYDRTGEESYQVGDFTVSQQQENQFIVRDRSGTVLQFQTASGKVKLMEMSDSLREATGDRSTQALIQTAIAQLSSNVPQGRHEADFAFRVSEAEQTVRDFLAYMKTSVWDYEQGKFRLEVVNNQVLITSKQDGRGQIHGAAKVMQKNNREKLVPQPTRLTWKDLEHLDRIRERLNFKIEADQAQQPRDQPVPIQPATQSNKPRQVSQRSQWQSKRVELD